MREKLLTILKGRGITGADAETALDAWVEQRLSGRPLTGDTVRVAAVFGMGINDWLDGTPQA